MRRWRWPAVACLLLAGCSTAVPISDDDDDGGDRCDAPQMACGGECVDPATNSRFCGATGDCLGQDAGTRCEGASFCVAGACQVAVLGALDEVTLDGDGNSRSYDLALGPGGELAIAGARTTGPLAFTGRDYAALVQLPGGVRWEAPPQFDDMFDGLFRHAAVGNDGAVVVGGQTGFGDPDCTLVRFAPDGTSLWTRTIGAGEAPFSEPGGGCRVAGVAVASDGGIYVAMNISTSSATRSFIRRYSQGGAVAWTEALSTFDGHRVADIAVGASGGLYVGGRVVPSPGVRQAVVVRFSALGSIVWNRTLDGIGTVRAVWASERVLVAGDESSGEGARVSVVQLDADGVLVRTNEVALADPSQEVVDVVGDASGRVYVSTAVRTFDLDDSTSRTRAAVHQWTADGGLTWSAASALECSPSLAVDTSDALFIAGCEIASDGTTRVGVRRACTQLEGCPL